MNSAPPVFVHLRLHTEFSLQDSVVRIPELVERVAALGMPAGTSGMIRIGCPSNIGSMVVTALWITSSTRTGAI